MQGKLFVSDLDKSDNRLLASLPLRVYQRLEPHLQTVELSQNQILNLAGEHHRYAYFPINCMISRVAVLTDGAMTEISIIGNEGMAGLPIILQTKRTFFSTIVQVSGYSLRIDGKKLQEELDRQETLKLLLMHYVQARIIQIGQITACNSHHKLE